MTHLVISAAMDKRLAALAEKAHVSKEEYARHALEEFLDDQEDYLEALEISLRVERGEEKTISYEEVRRQYNERFSH